MYSGCNGRGEAVPSVPSFLPSFLRALAVIASAIPALPWQSHRGLKLGEHALESTIMAVVFSCRHLLQAAFPKEVARLQKSLS